MSRSVQHYRRQRRDHDVGLHIENNLKAAEAYREEIKASGIDPYRDPPRRLWRR